MSIRLNGKIYTTHTGVNTSDGLAVGGKKFINSDGDITAKSLKVGLGGTAVSVINSTGDLSTDVLPTGASTADVLMWDGDGLVWATAGATAGDL